MKSIFNQAPGETLQDAVKAFIRSVFRFTVAAIAGILKAIVYVLDAVVEFIKSRL